MTKYSKNWIKSNNKLFGDVVLIHRLRGRSLITTLPESHNRDFDCECALRSVWGFSSLSAREFCRVFGNVFVLWGASPVTVRCASPVTAGVQVRSLSITDDLSHSPSDLPTRRDGTIMVHFLFFSPKKIPHHVENA
mgnify:CR=1 FL=1